MSDGLFDGLLNLKAPMDITPGKFFLEWLPAQVENFKELVDTFAGDLSFAVSVRVTGDNGGDWTVKLAAGTPEYLTGLDEEALVTFIVSEENFKEAITGQLDDLRPPAEEMPDVEVTPEEVKRRAKEVLKALREVEGILRTELDDPERALGATIKFGGPLKDKPDCLIKLKRDDVIAMAKGELDPQAAFMSGKIKIEGNSGLLMQLVALAM